MKLGLKWIIIFSFSLFKPDYNIAQGAQVFFYLRNGYYFTIIQKIH